MVMQATDTLLNLGSTPAKPKSTSGVSESKKDSPFSFKNTFEQQNKSAHKKDDVNAPSDTRDKRTQASADRKQVAASAREQSETKGGLNEAKPERVASGNRVQASESNEQTDTKLNPAKSSAQAVDDQPVGASQPAAAGILDSSAPDQAAIEGVLKAFGLSPTELASLNDGGAAPEGLQATEELLVLNPLDNTVDIAAVGTFVPSVPSLSSGVDASSLAPGVLGQFNSGLKNVLNNGTVNGLANGLAQGVLNAEAGETELTQSFAEKPISAFVAREQASVSTLVTTNSTTGLNAERSGQLSPQLLNVGLSNDSASLKQSSLDFTETMLAAATKGASLDAAVSHGSLTEAGSLSTQATALNAAQPRLVMPATISFGQPAWAGMVAERTASMAFQNIQFAELQLDPADLGPVHIKVSTHQDQATVVFTSANPQVREALDQSLAKLREMMAEEGMDLVDASVSDQSTYDDGEPGSEDDESQQDQQGLASANELIGDEHENKSAGVNINASYGVDSYV